MKTQPFASGDRDYRDYATMDTTNLDWDIAYSVRTRVMAFLQFAYGTVFDVSYY
jgi:hypothetical protein